MLNILTELHIDCIKVGIVKSGSNVRIGVRTLRCRCNIVALSSWRSERTYPANEGGVVSWCATFDVEVNTSRTCQSLLAELWLANSHPSRIALPKGLVELDPPRNKFQI